MVYYCDDTCWPIVSKNISEGWGPDEMGTHDPCMDAVCECSCMKGDHPCPAVVKFEDVEVKCLGDLKDDPHRKTYPEHRGSGGDGRVLLSWVIIPPPHHLPEAS